MPESASTDRRHATPEKRRAQILEAALRCFASRSYHEVRMDDLAEAAGLSKGSLYWHFRSKEEVYLALFDAFVDAVFAAWTREEAQASSALDALEREARGLIDQWQQQREFLGAWIQFFAHPRARERFASLYRASRERLARVIARGIAEGEIRDVPVAGAAAYLTGALEGMLLQALVDPEFALEAHWPAAWSMIAHGLRT